MLTAIKEKVLKNLVPLFLGITLVLVAIFFTTAILSYDKSDPSFNRVTSAEVKNLTGGFGAYIADPLLQSLGFASLIPIFFVLIYGLKLIKKRRFSYPLLRLSLVLFLCPIIALLITIPANNYEFTHGLGGFVGKFLMNELALRFEVSQIFWPALAISMVTYLFLLGVGLKEIKEFFTGFALNLWLFIQLVFWLMKFCYVAIFKLVSKAARIEVESEEYPEMPRPKLNVEIVNKPKILEVKAQVQSTLKLNPDDFELPTTTMLREVPEKNRKQIVSELALSQNSHLLQKVTEDFGINGEIVKIHPGPVVTLYEFEPSAGTKSSRVIGLADDIARSMSAISARISIIPGKSSMGIELPNAHREIVYLRELLESKTYQESEDKLPLILGKSISGEPIIADLSKMPHLLVAGTTGSGKSVAINTMILSLLYRYSPKQCRFIMIDPKMLELSVYDAIPHLLAPVVTEPKKAISALKWVVKEMENRYRLMATFGVRNIDGFNKAILDASRKGIKLEKQIQVGFNQATGEPMYEVVCVDDSPLPFIVVIVDEMADLMLVAGKDIESSIQRLAQMARAAGIHLIMATQRPSVDVITGVIKANFPTRISFQVTSKIDSRTILGEQGAEQLLGMGDMLYMRGGGRIERVHGPFVDDREVEAVANLLRSQGQPSYIENITITDDEEFAFEDGANGGDEDDGLYNQALKIVLKDRKASTSYIQRCLRIGYNRAANIIERMEREGIVSPPNHVGKREILMGGNQG